MTAGALRAGMTVPEGYGTSKHDICVYICHLLGEHP